ncbi:MAG: Gfo/Idh/MocA family oxidoreductase, partial [Gemmatimonadota bacterium]|nr:Gfo/Idh/MocA family oxidoreductase [Gemmatimonadota bacterium]
MTRPAIGVIGVGSLGRHHARVVRDLDGAASGGIFDIDGRRAEEIAQELGIDNHRSLEALLAGCQGVVVSVPTEAHEAVAMEALDRGVHVLIEKPLAPDLASARRILKRAEDAGLLVQVGHVERFNPGILAAAPYLERPLFIESHRLAPFSPRSLDVAVVLDLMIHDVDLVHSLVGEAVTEIAATGVPVITNHIDIANARLGFEGGAVSNLTASRISVERMRKIRVWQSSGYLSLNLATGQGEFYRPKGGGSVLEGVLAGGPPPPTG